MTEIAKQKLIEALEAARRVQSPGPGEYISRVDISLCARMLIWLINELGLTEHNPIAKEEAYAELVSAGEFALNYFINTQRSLGIDDESDDELESTKKLRSAIRYVKSFDGI